MDIELTREERLNEALRKIINEANNKDEADDLENDESEGESDLGKEVLSW